MNDITIPKNLPDLNSEERQGSLAQLLEANVGKFVRVEYDCEHSMPLTQQGVIYAVSVQYLLLWDERARTYSTGELSRLRSLVFFPDRIS